MKNSWAIALNLFAAAIVAAAIAGVVTLCTGLSLPKLSSENTELEFDITNPQASTVQVLTLIDASRVVFPRYIKTDELKKLEVNVWLEPYIYSLPGQDPEMGITSDTVFDISNMYQIAAFSAGLDVVPVHSSEIQSFPDSIDLSSHLRWEWELSGSELGTKSIVIQGLPGHSIRGAVFGPHPDIQIVESGFEPSTTDFISWYNSNGEIEQGRLDRPFQSKGLVIAVEVLSSLGFTAGQKELLNTVAAVSGIIALLVSVGIGKWLPNVRPSRIVFRTRRNK